MDAAPVIAIVDDDPSVRRTLLRVVTSAGYEGMAFASAHEFLAWLSVGRAACLVLDIDLGATSGFELQERLAVPVIFITAHDDATVLARIEKSTAAAHLIKPFEAETILEAIRRATKGTGVDQGPIGPPAEVGESRGSDRRQGERHELRHVRRMGQMTRAGTPSRALVRMAITGIYLVRGIPLDVQRTARARAVREGTTLRRVLGYAMREYAGGTWTPKPDGIHD